MNLVHRVIGGTEVLTGTGVQYQKNIQEAAYAEALASPENTITEYGGSAEEAADLAAAANDDIAKQVAAIEAGCTRCLIVIGADPDDVAAKAMLAQAVIDIDALEAQIT